ncbi:flagellar basal body P-ring formation chaperone FlgA [Thalassotalea atypica]|uniref:flagellar basal body P-ring formation chaperone FlgA n=1 Tax=Thalassotalea atypica TaxID=2054316 RepID=UPI00257377B0|nr:flagellar basal body P-ring formation chaperone FlgA [Thalassotalea atypica]
MRKIKLFLTFLLLQASLAQFSHAQIFDHDYIENFAKQALESSLISTDDRQISVSISPIDPRVTIKPCFSELSANIPENHNSRNVNVEISCADSTPWSLYIPARVKIMSPVVVALTAIDKGSLLTGDNIGVKFIDEKKIRGEKLTSTVELIGAKSRRNLSSGSAISRRNICVVCKGDSVTIEAHSAALSIRTAGVAMMNGYVGDKIKVKNERSGKLVNARISGLNSVKINL